MVSRLFCSFIDVCTCDCSSYSTLIFYLTLIYHSTYSYSTIYMYMYLVNIMYIYKLWIWHTDLMPTVCNSMCNNNVEVGYEVFVTKWLIWTEFYFEGSHVIVSSSFTVFVQWKPFLCLINFNSFVRLVADSFPLNNNKPCIVGAPSQKLPKINKMYIKITDKNKLKT